MIKSMPKKLLSFSNRTFERMPCVVCNALKQKTKSKSIWLYFLFITLLNPLAELI